MAFRAFLLAFCLACTAPRAAARPADPDFSSAQLGAVSEFSVLPIIEALEATPRNFLLRIDSPGGGVFAGLRLIEAMREAEARGTNVVCVVDGMAASMAGVILQACSERYMTRQSAILFHTVSVSEVEGNAWDLERLAKAMRALNRRLAIFVVGRLSIPMKAYEANTADADWWLGYEEAVAVGAVDAVL